MTTPTTPTTRSRALALPAADRCPRAAFRATLLAALLAAGTSVALARDVIYLQGAEANAALDDARSRLKAAPTDFEANKEAGILLHQLNRRSPSKDAVEQGEKYLKQANQANPKDAEASAWLGSITTMKAMFETDPGKQTFYVKLGARSMDGAVQQAPENLVVRLIRANNSMELPPFLKRTRFAVEDYQRYLALCETRSCPAAELASARTNLAIAQKRSAEAL